MSKLDNIIEQHIHRDLHVERYIPAKHEYRIAKQQLKDLMLELIGNPVGEDGIPNYDEPTQSILLELRQKVEQL